MKDNEIKQALPFLAKYCKDEYNDIRVDEVLLGAFDIINRQQAEIENCYQFIEQLEEARTLWNNKCNEQQAEIERLQNLTEKDFEQTAISTVKRHQKWIEYRAIKEFAERLKKAKQYSLERHENIVPVAVIDWIVKEMVGDTE